MHDKLITNVSFQSNNISDIDMFNIINTSCAYNNWVTTARESCADPDRYHCLTDEYSRPGWICTDPIWVEASEWQTSRKLIVWILIEFFLIKFKIYIIYTCINIKKVQRLAIQLNIFLWVIIIMHLVTFLCSLKFIFLTK